MFISGWESGIQLRDVAEPCRLVCSSMGEPEVVDVETVNVGHLMGYVDGEREEGNRAYKAGKHSEALVAWKRGLDAIAQADGLPMAVADVEVVLRARSVLHSNRGQALMSLQFWRRAIKDLTEALQVDLLPTAWVAYAAHRYQSPPSGRPANAGANAVSGVPYCARVCRNLRHKPGCRILGHSTNAHHYPFVSG